jgi:hypothetical protein
MNGVWYLARIKKIWYNLHKVNTVDKEVSYGSFKN